MIDKELLALIKGSRKYIVFSVLFSVLGLLANIGTTAGICRTLDLAIGGHTRAAVYVPPFVCIVCGILIRFAASVLAGRVKTVLGSRVKKDLRERVYQKTVALGAKSVDELSMAGLTQVSLEGIEQLDLYYTTYIPQFFYAVSAPLILFAVCVFIDFKTALVLLACVPLIPVSIIAVSKYAKRVFAKYWGKYTAMGDAFLDSVQGLKELKIFDADEAYNQRMNQSSENFRKITMKVLVMQLFSTTIMDLVAFGGAGAGIAVSVFSGASGLSPMAVLFLALVAVEFFLPLRAFGSAFHVAMNGASAGKKILTLLRLDEQRWGGGAAWEKPELRLCGVTFSYAPDSPVLRGADMVFPKNRVTAIVGESGSGKSTVVKLLTGEIVPQTGTVTVGGTALCALSRERYYNSLAVVGCNSYVFNDTVRNNFYLAAPDAAEADIWAALKKVNLDAFIRESGGLDRPIAEDGNDLSGGQKQRLALAVSLIAKKDFYIFDEATGNIDVESEAIIMDNIYALKAEGTVVVISHRLANVTRAENIYVLKAGGVAESGGHRALLAQNGEYARLYGAQERLEQGFEGAYHA
ncbi:MAG: ABC transporter ATP-binding protein/permease [Clostridiales bacterium]|jgi:ABC-type transport system involved in cytochrome bd biosynthesis fused ATPase/permease subunit|nr:ABC transporter ATP-binding protein/permease [Clostridiales bacterium]